MREGELKRIDKNDQLTTCGMFVDGQMVKVDAALGYSADSFLLFIRGIIYLVPIDKEPVGFVSGKLCY